MSATTCPTNEPYLAEAVAALPRLLGGFDRSPISPTFGVGDRFHWAWGLIDFPNATFQGSVHGLARLWVNDLWPYDTDEERFVGRVDTILRGIAACTASDGTLSEAFPNEGSWCVTALVAFDALTATELLTPVVGSEQAERWREPIAPLISSLRRTDETHALISNHLATGAAALDAWSRATGCEASRRSAASLVDRILSHQHDEGWYVEYQGADPGYQSLATYYLAHIAKQSTFDGLDESLARSVRFLGNFVHPDGSFGGYYGSRNTRLYVPAGLHLLASTSTDAAAIAKRMAESVAARTVVTLASIDPPNEPPLFNAYCLAATIPVDDEPTSTLPCDRQTSERMLFPGAGLIVDAGARHFTVISVKKGGVVQHYVDGHERVIDSGATYRDQRGRIGSTQAYDDDARWELGDHELEVTSTVRGVVAETPRPIQFAALRLAAVSILRLRPVREWIKRRLVKRLITGDRRWDVVNRRSIHLGPDLTVTDDAAHVDGVTRIDPGGPFTAIHMASQGYWQVQDERR